MYVCMFVCIYVSMYVRVYVCMYVIYAEYVMYVCMYVRMYVCMYVLRTPAASHRRPLEIIILWIDPLELSRVDRLLGRRIIIRRR